MTVPSCSDHAIVLRLADYSETSQVVTFFAAEYGLARVLAKGVRRSTRRRFAVGLDLLEYGEVSFLPARGDAQLGTLTDWLQLDSFGGLRRDLSRLYAALYAAELTEALTQEHDPHPGLFAALKFAMAGLAGDAAPLATAVEFQGRLLTEIGYAPNLSGCAVCGKVRTPGSGAYFSSRAGGLLCRNCARDDRERVRVSARLLDSSPIGANASGWFGLLHRYLMYVGSREFRTGRTLERLLTARPGR